MYNNFYIAEIEWYTECKKEITHGLYIAKNLIDAMHQVKEDYGNEENIISVKLTGCGDGLGYGLIISESLADALIHDLSEYIICTPSDWRKENDRKLKEKCASD